MNIYQFLKKRGYIYQQTNQVKTKELLSSNKKITFYLGIDPTADSLHIGHFFALMMFRYLQEANHQGILLIGGATALIPDPTGKQQLRTLLTKEDVDNNIKEVTKLCKRFIITKGDKAAIILNNAEWINKQSYVDFMREIGINFNVNTMLKADAYAERLKEGGLTFLEMGYMLMQAYDFKYLFEHYNCLLQIGGSDQWANIIAGYDLIRKMLKKDVYGLTCPLLVDSKGQKMGKTSKGALWVAKDKMTVYDFYQYWINIDDREVESMLRLLTKIKLGEIKRIVKDDIFLAKKRMAFEITSLIHGKKEAEIARKTAKSLFENKIISDNMPQIILTNLKGKIRIVDLLVESKIASSKSDARRLIKQGGIKLNKETVTDDDLTFNYVNLKDKDIIIQRGKRMFKRIVID